MAAAETEPHACTNKLLPSRRTAVCKPLLVSWHFANGIMIECDCDTAIIQFCQGQCQLVELQSSICQAVVISGDSGDCGLVDSDSVDGVVRSLKFHIQWSQWYIISHFQGGLTPFPQFGTCTTATSCDIDSTCRTVLQSLPEAHTASWHFFFLLCLPCAQCHSFSLVSLKVKSRFQSGVHRWESRLHDCWIQKRDQTQSIKEALLFVLVWDFRFDCQECRPRCVHGNILDRISESARPCLPDCLVVIVIVINHWFSLDWCVLSCELWSGFSDLKVEQVEHYFFVEFSVFFDVFGLMTWWNKFKSLTWTRIQIWLDLWQGRAEQNLQRRQVWDGLSVELGAQWVFGMSETNGFAQAQTDM